MNSFDSRYMTLQVAKFEQILSKEKTVVSVAKELGVSRQIVHKRLSRYKRFGIEGLITKRKKREGVPHNKTSEEIEELVSQVAQKYWQDGVETLSDRMQAEYNMVTCPTTIYRILKRKNIRYTTLYPHTRKKWKKQLYSHSIPGKELQMDTKYPYGYKEGRVIYTIIDDASRWVFAYCYARANQENTLDFLEKVTKNAPFPIQKIRTDQGKEFIANTVKEYLKTKKVSFRNNTPYCPEENGKIERFHRTLNEKALKPGYAFRANQTLEEMQYQLTLFLYYYNFQKKHRGLGMDGMTPFEKLQEKASVNLTLQCYIYAIAHN